MIWQLWLTWRLIEQEHRLSNQWTVEHLNQAADSTIDQLDRTLGAWRAVGSRLNELPPSADVRDKIPQDAEIFLLMEHSSDVYPRRPLLWVPNPPLRPMFGRVFDAAELLESQKEYDAAADRLRVLAQHHTLRPEALVRLARLERKRNHQEAALAIYDSLSHYDSPGPSGVPYALTAFSERRQLLSETGQSDRAIEEAEALQAALRGGRWPLSLETFESYWAGVNRFLHPHDVTPQFKNPLEVFARTPAYGNYPPPKASLDLALQLSRKYDEWKKYQRGRVECSSFSSIEGIDYVDNHLYTVVVRCSVFVQIRAPLSSVIQLPANANDVHWTAERAVRNTLPGNTLPASLIPVPLPQPPARKVIRRSASQTFTFWTEADGSKLGTIRGLLLGGVGLTLLLVAAGVYFASRGINRELRIAELQSDFISAVSHEFRSPLTTLVTITELLAQNRISSEALRQESYVFLGRETARLHRLVEDLLDFRGMEAGQKQHRLEPRDFFAVARTAVTEFHEEVIAENVHIDTSFQPGVAIVLVDDKALLLVFRNLLENAIKYSPDCRTVWVEGAISGSNAVISVRDHGMGIAPSEQQAIFQKFVRGTAAKKAGIKGTGIGLSMVREIINAMGGQITVDSGVGCGSKFSVLLPLAGDRETTG